MACGLRAAGLASVAMPEPIRHDQRYMPGLDGLRALAVLAVIAYHLGFGWAAGGLLGVGVFFTRSGPLITDLLLAGPPGGRGSSVSVRTSAKQLARWIETRALMGPSRRFSDGAQRRARFAAIPR